jgi:glycosyltransferase involved in cell wall biosynthesis
MSASQKVRVLHIIDSFELGGAQTALLNLVGAIDRDRYQPEVACMHGRGVFWNAFAALGIPVHSLSPRKWLPLYLWRLARLLRAESFSIVHCHLFGANWIAKPLAALLGVPVRINHDQCNDILRHQSRAALALDRFTNRWSSHICAVSASTQHFLLAREGVPVDRISLVYNGVDLSRFVSAAERPRAKPFIVLGVGRLSAQKNFELFLEAASQISREFPETRFQIAGTGPEERILHAQAAALGLGDRVTFLGHVDDTRALYARAHALLMTSRFEGTPLAVLEAMAMRVPIVAPKLDGIGEILTHERDALVVERRSGADFAYAVGRLIREPELGPRLASAAEATVRERFSARTMAEQVEAVYERCLSAAGIASRPAA